VGVAWAHSIAETDPDEMGYCSMGKMKDGD